MPTHESTSHVPSPEADGDRDDGDNDDGDNERRSGVNDAGPDGIIDDESEVKQLPIEPEPPRTENIMLVLLGAFLAAGLVVVTVYPGTF